MQKKTYFNAMDVALMGVFSALWAILTVTLGRFGFALFGLPVFCDFAAFFTLLLSTWIISKFGVASIVGIIGSVITFMLNSQSTVFGFTAAAILFDMLLSASQHRIRVRVFNLIFVALATLVSAYFAGVIIGLFFMARSADWVLTIWCGWHLVGGIISVVVAIPVVSVLEKANLVRAKNGS
jgi:MFS family permease